MRNAFIRALRSAVVAMVSVMGLVACGGGGDPAPVAAPVINQQPMAQSVQQGASATFSVLVQSAEAVTYQWLRNGAEVGGGNAASYTLVAAALADSGTRWSVRATNAGGSVVSAEAVLTVTAPPPQPGIEQLATLDIGGGRLAVDASGNIFVMRYEAGRGVVVRKYGPDGTPQAFGSGGLSGTALPNSDTGATTMRAATLDTDAAGNVYAHYTNGGVEVGGLFHWVITSGFIYRLSAAGEVSSLGTWPGTLEAPPFSIAVSPDGVVHVLDASSVRRLESDGRSTVVALAPTVPSDADRTSLVLALDGGGRIYVMDTSLDRRTIQRLEGQTWQTVATLAQRLSSVAFDGNGRVYLRAGELIQRVDTNGSVMIVAGQPGVSATGLGPLPGSLISGGELAFAPDGTLLTFSGSDLLRIRLP